MAPRSRTSQEGPVRLVRSRFTRRPRAARLFAIGTSFFLLVLLVFPSETTAQEPTGRDQVISANPFGLLLELFNAEYERKLNPTSTLGLGGSFIDLDEETYVNFDGFWRYYPQGRVFDGWAFGAKLGLTRVDEGTYAGFGFDVNRSWLLGPSENFYVGIGFGLKRLVGTDDASFDALFIPTLRIVNVGIAF
ncbi:MAG: hypothetical protein HKN71_10555 [Gemmatimonadetes bacterium]|nr:hypothetical protein [Gemmatimonadota bacterium]